MHTHVHSQTLAFGWPPKAPRGLFDITFGPEEAVLDPVYYYGPIIPVRDPCTDPKHAGPLQRVLGLVLGSLENT